MAIKFIIFLYLLSTVKSNAINNVPEVHENTEEDKVENNIRVARQPNFYERNMPPIFDFKTIQQQDPQPIRYAQQQQVDSYVRAYQQSNEFRRGSKSHKDPKSFNYSPSQAKTAYDTRPKSETTKQINFNFFPVETNSGVVSDQYGQKKVVDPKTVINKMLNDDNLQKNLMGSGNQNLNLASQLLSYQVNEDTADLEPQGTNMKQAQVYIGNEESLKTAQSSLSANYLAKPTYILANPKLNIDPKILAQGFSSLPMTNIPEGFQPASQADLEALSSLLGKSQNSALEGLNELLDHKSLYAPVPTQTAAPEQVQVAIKPLQIALKSVPIQHEQLLPSPTLQETHHEVHVQPTTLKLNIPQVDIKAHTSINHQVQIVPPETTKNYEAHDDNLQYAAQYAFGYKIRDYHSGSNFGHEEVREGDVAKGHYHVLLPDGRLQNVEYWADPSGYHAKVTYSHAHH